MHNPTPAPPAWPLRTIDDGPAAARPSALIRRRAIDAEGQRLEGSLSLREELVGVPEESGLFGRVQHQEGFEGFVAEADYTLDFALHESVETGWYTALGLIPGIPLVGHWLWRLECGVLDREREVLTRVEVEREGTVIAWSVFLPFNLLLTPIPGHWLGFDLIAVAEDQRRMIDGMLKEALQRVDARVGFFAVPHGVEGGAPR